MRHRGVIRKGSRPDDLPALFYLRPHVHVHTHAQMHADVDAQAKNLQTPRHFRSRRTANCSGRHAWRTRTCLRTCPHTCTGASIRARKNLKHHVIFVQTRIAQWRPRMVHVRYLAKTKGREVSGEEIDFLCPIARVFFLHLFIDLYHNT